MISWRWLSLNRARVLRWGGIFSGFAMVQLLVQVLNAVAGFLLVRTLEKPDYAWFTIASGMSAALSVLSDSGIGTAVTSIGGRVWQDRASLKGLVEAAMRLRMRMAFFASVVVGCLSLWLLMRNDAPLLTSVLLTAVVIAPIWCITTTALFSVVNRLHSRTLQLQIADVMPAMLRVGTTLMMVWLGWLSPLTAGLAVLAAHAAQFMVVRRQVLPLLGTEEPSDIAAHQKEVWMLARRLLPNSVFICVQGQLATWIISVFATNSEVADFGALNRVGIVFAVLGGPVTQFVAPAFARAVTRHRLRALVAGVVTGSLIFSGALLVAVWWKGEWFLWLLGGKYGHLREELVLVLAGMSVASVCSMLWALNAARGWTRLSWLSIPVTLATQAAASLFFPLETVKGLACFGIASAIAQCIHALITCLVYLCRRRAL